eukprot:204130-Amphidinium_carterae.1
MDSVSGHVMMSDCDTQLLAQETFVDLVSDLPDQSEIDIMAYINTPLPTVAEELERRCRPIHLPQVTLYIYHRSVFSFIKDRSVYTSTCTELQLERERECAELAQ